MPPVIRPLTVVVAAFRRAGRAVEDAFSEPSRVPGAAVRMMVVLGVARPVLGLLAIAGALLTPNLGAFPGDRLALILATVYLPFTLAAFALLSVSHRAPMRMLLAAGDVAAICAVSVFVPSVQVIALVAYAFVVGFYSVLGGRIAGAAVVAAVTAAAAIAREVASPGAQPDTYALVMLPVALLGLVLVTDAAGSERRRVVRFLARLQHAISRVAPGPDLEATLDSICAVARTTVGAKFASVLVRDGESLAQGALEGDLAGSEGVDPKERSQQMIARIMAQPETSPSGLALKSGQVVVVKDIRTDARFSHWADEAGRQRFTSTIAVPLRTGQEVIGVLAAYLPDPSLVSRENIDLLSAYADHVSLVVLRAFAYEHEREAALALMEADEIKSDLVATISHELRTPLTSVKGFIDTLLLYWDRFEDDERRDLLRRARRNADTLTDLVNRVLDFSRLEAEAVDVSPVASDLGAAVGAFLEEHQPAFAEHRLVVDVPDGLTAWIDTEALGHVLSNLVANAVKYAPPATAVTIRARRDGEAVRVTVTDEGPGIPEHERIRIFDRFHRSRAARTTRGTGIGLAIVKRYVELMGGDVGVDSRPGEGSTFWFTLPIATAVGDGGRRDADAGDATAVAR